MAEADREKIKELLNSLKQEADEGRLEGFLCIDVRRGGSGEPLATLTLLLPDSADDEISLKIREHLQGLARQLHELYST